MSTEPERSPQPQDPFAPKEHPFVEPEWLADVCDRYHETGEVLALPVDELSDGDPGLCERLFMNEQEAFLAGLAIGEERAQTDAATGHGSSPPPADARLGVVPPEPWPDHPVGAVLQTLVGRPARVRIHPAVRPAIAKWAMLLQRGGSSDWAEFGITEQGELVAGKGRLLGGDDEKPVLDIVIHDDGDGGTVWTRVG